MELKDVISLAEAAEELGLGASTLRHQAQDGRLEARVVGKTWITTRQEVERYRRENLGRVGRPAITAHPSAATGQGAAHNPTVVVEERDRPGR